MSKNVVESVNPSYTGVRGLVTSIGAKHTDVADLSDIINAKKELSVTINEIKKILEGKISSTNERIEQIAGIPDDIREVIEKTNNQQEILLRNVYREIADNLAKQQQSLEASCTKANGYIQQLNKKHEEAEQIYSRILSINNTLSAHTEEIASLKKKTTWLFVLVSFSLLIGLVLIGLVL